VKRHEAVALAVTINGLLLRTGIVALPQYDRSLRQWIVIVASYRGAPKGTA